MINYNLYVLDCETTGLDFIKNDIIELSISRFHNGEQKTWRLKPLNSENIDTGALRVNGHKLEDLLHQTKYGRETYLDPNDIIIEIENWIMEDGISTENRVMVGHNISFDNNMLQQLWIKCNSKDSFPFGRRTMDTMIVEFFLNYCEENMAEGYSLNNLSKKYGVKNDKAHSAASDCLTTFKIINKQISFFKEKLKKK